MIKMVNVGKYSTLKVPDTFLPAVVETNGGSREVAVHFGANMDIVVCVAKSKKLSEDNQKRIHILTSERQ